ncbi:MAG: hypothetical protein R3D58_13305 [Saprospiraceae bacterium]
MDISLKYSYLKYFYCLTFTLFTASIKCIGQSTDAYYCGPISINNSDSIIPFNLPGVYFDQFGNYYFKSDIEVPQTSPETVNCGCDEFQSIGINTQYFNLTFLDCIYGTGIGFNAPVSGYNRRKAICKAYASLASLISNSSNPCDNSEPTINIKILRSDTDLPNNVLGGASPIFSFTNLLGLNSGSAHQAIISGIDPLGGGLYHAFLVINFSDFDFYTDFDDPNGILGTNLFDLYSVALHESLHSIGFLSQISWDGSSKLTGAPIGGFTHFDSHLELTNGISIIENNPVNSPFFEKSAAIALSDLYMSCLDNVGINGPDMQFVSPKGQNIPIFTGSSYQQGSSFSHLCSDDTSPNFVMKVGISKNSTSHVIQNLEKRILCDIGYKLNNFTNCDCSIAASADVGPSCSDDLFTVSFCPGNDLLTTTLDIVPGDILGNDIGLSDIVYFSPMTPIGNGNLTDNGNGTWTFRPDHIGTHILRYVGQPMDQCGEPNVGAIYINAVIPEDCNAFCGLPPLDCDEASSLGYIGCEEFFDCDKLINDCNLICNPSFCASYFSNSTIPPSVPGGECNFPNCIDGSYIDVPGWRPFHNRIEFGFQTTSVNSGSLSMTAGLIGATYYGEGITTTFSPLKKESNYLFSVYTKSNLTQTGSILSIDLVDQSLLHYQNPYQANYTGVIVPLFTDLVFPGTNFKRFAKCFNVPNNPDNYNSLYIHTHDNNNADRIYSDDYELIEDNFSAGEDITVACGQEVILGGENFCMLSEVEIGYQWTDANDELVLQYSVRQDFYGALVIHDGQGNLLNEIPSITIIPSNTTHYTLTRYIIDNGGILGLELCTYSDIIDINVIGWGDACFSANLCGQTVSVVPNSSGENNIWDMGDNSFYSNSNAFTHTYTSPGTYKICRQVGTQCPMECCYEITVPQNDPLNPEFTIQHLPCNTDAQFSPIDQGWNHSWDFDGLGASTEPNPIFIFPELGEYEVSHTISNECESKSITKTINLDCEFRCPCDNGELNIVASDDQLGTSILETIIPSLTETFFGLPNSLVNTCLAIKGKIIIDQGYSLNIIGGEIRMQPGSEIVVKDGSALTFLSIDQNGGVHGCEEMWKGIYVESGAQFNMYTTDIKDAIHAITLRDNSTTNLLSNNFENNYIGVHTPWNAGSIQSINTIYPINDNLFNNSSPLLPPYDGQISHAGFELNDAILMIGLPSGAGTNTFKNLTYGIKGDHCFLAVKGSIFDNMVKGILPFTGTAIYLEDGLLLVDDCTINTANMGIVTASSYSAIRNNEIHNVNFGAKIALPSLGFYMLDNDLTYYALGVEIASNNDPILIRPKISNNIFTSILLNNPYGASTGISLSNIIGSSLSTNHPALSQVNKNEFNLDYQSSGITLGDCSLIGIEENVINFNNLTPPSPNLNATRGIGLINSSKCRVFSNSIFAPITSDVLFGIHSGWTSSTQNTYCCNTITGPNHGFYFEGNCDKSDIRNNEMSSNTDALRAVGSTVLGPQSLLNNRWNGSVSHFGSPIFQLASQFTINTCNQPQWPNQIEPSQSCIADPTQWFTLLESSVPICSNDRICNTPLFNNLQGGGNEEEYVFDTLTTNEILASQGLFLEGQVGDTLLQYELTRKLFNKVNENPTIFGENVDVDSFYLDALGQNIAMFYDVTQFSTKESLNDSLYSKNTQDNLNAIDSLLIILESFDTLIMSGDSINIDSSLSTSKLDILQSLKSRITSILMIKHELEVDHQNNVSQAEEINDSIIPSNLFESNEKEMNKVFFATLDKNILTLDSLQIESVTNVAFQCILRGGSAVIRARQLYRLIDPAIDFTGIDTCSGIDYRSDHDLKNEVNNKTINLIKFSPNPTTGQLLVESSITNQYPIELIVKYLDGRLAKKILIGDSKTVVDLGGLPNGVYVALISSTEGILNLQKIILISK